MGEVVDRVRGQLERALTEHESTSARLKALRKQIDIEIEMHEVLLSLGRNERLLDYLGQLEEDFSRAGSLKGNNGLSDKQRHELQIPSGVSLEVGPDTTSLADVKMFVRHGTWLVEIAWHAEHGLVVRPIEGHLGAALASTSLETTDEERSLSPSGNGT